MGTNARRRAAFRQSDVKRALAAAKAAGIDIARVEIDARGTIVIIAKSEGDEIDRATLSPVEAWKARRHARPS